MIQTPSALRTELETAQKPILKILQHRGARLAIKLEAIFWSQLSEIARDRKTRTSKLVFDALEGLPEGHNKTSFLRCLCMDSLRRRHHPSQSFANQNFDLMAIIAACPTPVAVITIECRLVAINPAFSTLTNRIRGTENAGQRAINLSFNELMPKIVANLIKQPQNIPTYHVGVKIGTSPARHFPARFTLADQSKAKDSLIVIYLLA